MNLVTKLVTNCFLCCTKYNISYDQTRSNLVESSNLNPDYFVDNISAQLHDLSMNNKSNNNTNNTASGIDNHLSQFLLKENNLSQNYLGTNANAIIDECLLSAAINNYQTNKQQPNFNNTATNNNNRYNMRTKGSTSNLSNPHHRFSNYLSYTSAIGNQQSHPSRSDSCGPAFRSRSGILN